VVGAVMWWIGHLLGGLAGAATVVVLLVLLAGWMYLRARRAPVDHRNVNDEWQSDATADRADLAA